MSKKPGFLEQSAMSICNKILTTPDDGY